MPPEMRRMANGLTIMEPKVYRPTWNEFQDFNKFMEMIEQEGAGEAGICKVIPPEEWVPRKRGYEIADLDFVIDKPVFQRFTPFGDRGAFQTKCDVKEKMTVSEYYDLSNSARYSPPAFMSHEDAEHKYWKSLMYSSPLYGCDVAAPLSDQDLKEWNISNLGCILDLIKQDENNKIKGVLSPYLYFGMWKATFSWHVEDLDLYAINAVHYGAPKTWYCVPPRYGYMLEQLAKMLFPSIATLCTNFMRHKTCLISPQILEKYGIPYQKLVQEEREIIITFPYAYHQGFNHGFNIAESTNFATERWVEFGKRSKPCDCERTRVQFPMDVFVKQFQPERYNAWINKTDIAPHPMDPPDIASKAKLQSENPEEYARLMTRALVSKKRQKGSTEDEKSGHDKDGRKFVRYNVYQHHQLANVLVRYNPATGKIRQGAARLANFFDNPNIPQLISQGYLIKVATVKCYSKGGEKPKTLKFKCMEENLIVNVHPETFQLKGPPSKRLQDFLQKKKSDLKTLIHERAFREIIVPKLGVTHQKVMKKRLFLQAFKTKLIPLVKLKHVESNSFIKVWPETQEPAYKLPNKMSSLLKSSTVKDLIKDGILSVEGEVLSKMKQLAKVPISAPPSLTCDLYHTATTNLPVRVATKANLLLDRELAHIKELCQGVSIQDLIASKELVYSSTMELTRRSSNFETASHHDTYDPEDLIQDSDLNHQFVYENDPDYPIEDNTMGLTKGKTRDSFWERLRATRLKNSTPVDEKTVATLTRDIVDHFQSEFSDIKYPTFDLEYFKRFCTKNEDEGLLVPVLHILEDLRIVSQNKELSSSYIWLGPETTDFREVFWYFLERQHRQKKESNRYKIVFREVLLLLLEKQKGLHVHLKYFAHTNFGKFVELRRVSLASGVLQGLDLVERLEGDLGTVFWTGEDVYRDWTKLTEMHHLSRRCVVSLSRAKVDSDKLQRCHEEGKDRLRALILTPSGSSQEAQSKKAKLCKCGYIKSVNVITNLRGKVGIRKGVVAGNKRRTRCYVCDNCLRAPCQTCIFCTKKTLKKPCIFRVCVAPKNPNCPCFANTEEPGSAAVRK